MDNDICHKTIKVQYDRLCLKEKAQPKTEAYNLLVQI
jgi:hypothetical protein